MHSTVIFIICLINKRSFLLLHITGKACNVAVHDATIFTCLLKLKQETKWEMKLCSWCSLQQQVDYATARGRLFLTDWRLPVDLTGNTHKKAFICSHNKCLRKERLEGGVELLRRLWDAALLRFILKISTGSPWLSAAALTARCAWRAAELPESREVDRSVCKASMASASDKWRMGFTVLQPWPDPPTEPPRTGTRGSPSPRTASSPGSCLWRRCWSPTSSPSTRSRHGRCATSAAAGSGRPARRWRLRPPSSCTGTEPWRCGAPRTVGPPAACSLHGSPCTNTSCAWKVLCKSKFAFTI